MVLADKLLGLQLVELGISLIDPNEIEIGVQISHAGFQVGKDALQQGIGFSQGGLDRQVGADVAEEYGIKAAVAILGLANGQLQREFAAVLAGAGKDVGGAGDMDGGRVPDILAQFGIFRIAFG